MNLKKKKVLKNLGKNVDRNKDADIENGLEDMGRVGWEEVREWHGHIYTTKCKIDSYWEAAT